ncbi:unknown [Bacteroides sp. CAG:661]|nr:unknown [Bacteroides sp. CAG:661]
MGHTRDNLSGTQHPRGGHAAVFYPHIVVALGKLDAHLGVLGEDGGAGLHLAVHDAPLVGHLALQGDGARKQLAAGAVVIELATRQRQDGHRQGVQLVVGNARMGTQRPTEVGVEVVVAQVGPGHGRVGRPFGLERALLEQLDGTVAQEPDADVHQEEMGLRQVFELSQRGLLKHEVEHFGRLAVGHEHAVMGGQHGVHPQAVAHDVGLRDVLQGLLGADVDVAAGNEGAERLGGTLHNLFIKRELQGEQVLSQLLATLPAEHGQRRQNLARGGIGGQATALAAGMEEDALLGAGLGGAVLFPLAQEPGGAATRTQLHADGVGRTKPFICVHMRKVGKGLHQVGRQ